jgi:hypothetical protein
MLNANDSNVSMQRCFRENDEARIQFEGYNLRVVKSSNFRTLVERLLTLNVRVDTMRNPSSHFGFFGRIAQLGERCPYKAEVTGSIPVPPTTVERMRIGLCRIQWSATGLPNR